MIVIGGGLAGLSSALALAEAGYQVRLYEKRPHLGGRAASYMLPDGTEVDNCQHVTLGCCTNLEDFYRRAGVLHLIRFFERVVFLDRQGRRAELWAAPLPAPLHLAPALAAFRCLALHERWAVGRALWEIARRSGNAEEWSNRTMLEWLRARKQPEGAIERFWRVVLVSALDEELDRVAAPYGFQVFWQAFLRNRRGYRVGVPAVPLGRLYDGCRQAIEARGGQVQLRMRARRLRVRADRVEAVEFEDGTDSADFYVVAVPPRALRALLDDELCARQPEWSYPAELASAPITGIHLWFDRPVLQEPFVGLIGTTSQWVFNKTRLLEQTAGSAATGQYLQVVVSASYALVERSRQEIVELCGEELRQLFPAARQARLVRAVVVKEIEATFSPTVGADGQRLPTRSRIENLVLAGDWTQTGWPATMEGAVRSGYLAAEAILAACRRCDSLLQPDLPPEGLARLWLHR